MSAKNDILKKIEQKAQKIREKRVEASNNNTLESVIFDFFKHVEEARRLKNGVSYDKKLLLAAMKAMETRVRAFDYKAKTSLEWQPSEDEKSWEEGVIRGVTVWWSDAYIAKNNVAPSMYIDVGQMLIF
jgi:hypothetical protein